MLDWAFTGFPPKGSEGFAPIGTWTSVSICLCHHDHSINFTRMQSFPLCCRVVFVIFSSSFFFWFDLSEAPLQTSSDSSLSDQQPPAKRKYVLKNKAHTVVSTYNRGRFFFFPSSIYSYIDFDDANNMLFLSLVTPSLFVLVLNITESIIERINKERKTIERKLSFLQMWNNSDLIGPNFPLTAFILTARSRPFALPDFCLSCGSSEIAVQHPLFEGGLCLKCKVTRRPNWCFSAFSAPLPFIATPQSVCV